MASEPKVKLNLKGIRKVLKSQETAHMVHQAAEMVANNAREDTKAPVVVNDYTTDRAASAVTIASDGGLTIQARDGVLTQAAGEVGAEVTEK